MKFLLEYVHTDSRSLRELRREAISEMVAELVDHWSVERLLYAKLAVRLSTRSWEALMRVLFMRFDAKLKCPVPLSVQGVQLPRPPGRYQFGKLMTILRERYGLERVQFGAGAALDLLAQICRELKAAFDSGAVRRCPLTNRLVGVNGEPMELVFTWDGFRLHKKVKLIAFCWKFSNAVGRAVHSPLVGNHYMLLQTNKEDATIIREAMGKQLDVVNALMDKKTISVQLDALAPETVDLVFAGTNDMPAQAAQCGLAGVSSNCPCDWCEIRTEDIMLADVSVQRGQVLRTIANIRLSAHLDLGVCRGCGMEIVDKVTNRATQMQRAKVGDLQPSSVPKVVMDFVKTTYKAINDARKKAGLNPLSVPTSWTAIHFGVQYAQGMLINLEPLRCAIDLLHLNSCICRLLYTILFWNNLGKFTGTQTREQMFEKVYNLFLTIGMVTSI